MKISIIGSGYVGLVTGTCFAELGNKVTLVDVMKDKVEKINSGIAPIYEDKLDRMLKKNVSNGNLKATTKFKQAILDTHITFISVGTPSKSDGSIDLVHVENVAKEIGKSLKEKTGYHTIVMKSTVVPRTTEDILLPMIEKYSGKSAGKDFGIAMNPEFLKEGVAIDDFMNPDRIVIGAIDEKSYERVYSLYDEFKCDVMMTNPRTAEMIKYASNAFLATKISFSNEIGNLCKKLDIDSYTVADGMSHDERIERKFLNSGIGYGGSCFPKDVNAIISKGKNMNVGTELMDAVEGVNQKQPLKLVDILKEKVGNLNGKTIAVLGLAFKPGTDDIREAPSLKIISELLKLGAEVKAYDPKATENFRREFPDVKYMLSASAAIEDSDACLILTEWPNIKNLTNDDFKKMKGNLIIEGRRILDPEKVSGFYGICW